jgi:hypothetical protein
MSCASSWLLPGPLALVVLDLRAGGEDGDEGDPAHALPSLNYTVEAA